MHQVAMLLPVFDWKTMTNGIQDDDDTAVLEGFRVNYPQSDSV